MKRHEHGQRTQQTPVIRRVRPAALVLVGILALATLAIYSLLQRDGTPQADLHGSGAKAKPDQEPVGLNPGVDPLRPPREVHVRVVDAGTGLPIAAFDWTILGRVSSAELGKDGRLAIVLDPRLSSPLGASLRAPGYETAQVELPQPAGNESEASEVEVRLSPLVIFRGNVRSSSGAAVPDAHVALEQVASASPALAVARTNQHGEFELHVKLGGLPTSHDRRIVARTDEGLTGVVEAPWPGDDLVITLLDRTGTLRVSFNDDWPDDLTRPLTIRVRRTGVTRETRSIPVGITFEASIPGPNASAVLQVPRGTYEAERVTLGRERELLSSRADLYGTEADLSLFLRHVGRYELRITDTIGGRPVPGATVLFDDGAYTETDSAGFASSPRLLQAGQQLLPQHARIEHPEFVEKRVLLSPVDNGDMPPTIELSWRPPEERPPCVQLVARDAGPLTRAQFMVVKGETVVGPVYARPSARPDSTHVLQLPVQDPNLGVSPGALIRVEASSAPPVAAALIDIAEMRESRDRQAPLRVEFFPLMPFAVALRAPDRCAQAGIEVHAWSRDIESDARARPSAALGVPHSSAMTGHDGVARLKVAASGPLYIVALDASGLATCASLDQRSRTDVDLVVAPAIECVGTCTLEAGVPMSASLRITPLGLPPGLSRAFEKSTSTDAQGRFAVDLAPCCDWLVTAYARAGGHSHTGTSRWSPTVSRGPLSVELEQDR